MTMLTTSLPTGTEEARFLAPETHPRAKGGEPKASPRGAASKRGKSPRRKAPGPLPALLQPPGELLSVPLSQLVLSPLNVRKQGGEDVTELAALIKSQTLLQNLVVVPHLDRQGRETGQYGVVAGGRRLRALQLLCSQGDLHPDQEVLCRLTTPALALAASAAENSAREPMSAADTVVAFADMVAAGATPEDLAITFGVEPITVHRRLKLAQVSAPLFELFRHGEMELEQLMALALSDDHEAQERVWETTPSWDRSARTLRRLLLNDQQVEVQRDPVARFVGAEAYVAAGGVLIRDLFQDEETGYVADVELLHRLANERLAHAAEIVRQEGWSWVETRLVFEHRERSGFGEAPTRLRDATEEERAKRLALEAARDRAAQQLDELCDLDDVEADQVDALEQAVDEADDAIRVLDRARRDWPMEVRALAGAVVSIERPGVLAVHRGLVRREDRRQMADQGRARRGAARRGGRRCSLEHLRRCEARQAGAFGCVDFQAHRPQEPGPAGAARRPAAGGPRGARAPAGARADRGAALCVVGALQADSRDHALRAAADDLEEAPSSRALTDRVDAWRERLPGDPDKLFAWLSVQPLNVLVELLALCVGLCASFARGHEPAEEQMAAALQLDMADWWTPTAASYFNQVPKARIAEVVTEALGAPEAVPLLKMKKAEAAAAAERLMAGTRWVPELMRVLVDG
jgi:ParB family chromosome partitioning protein